MATRKPRSGGVCSRYGSSPDNAEVGGSIPPSPTESPAQVLAGVLVDGCEANYVAPYSRLRRVPSGTAPQTVYSEVIYRQCRLVDSLLGVRVTVFSAARGGPQGQDQIGDRREPGVEVAGRHQATGCRAQIVDAR